MNKDWTDKLREQLAAHEEPASRDLWADIEARLGEAAPADVVAESPSPKARTVALRRWAVAAVVAAVLAGGGVVWFQSLPVTKDSPTLAAEDSPSSASQEPQIRASQEPQIQASQEPLMQASQEPQTSVASSSPLLWGGGVRGGGDSHALAKKKENRSLLPTTPNPSIAFPPAKAGTATFGSPEEGTRGRVLLADAAKSAVTDAVTSTAETPNNTSSESTKAATAAPQKNTADTPYSNTLYSDLDAELYRDLAMLAKDSERGRLSLGLYALNGFAGGSTVQPVMMEPALANSFNAVSDYGTAVRRGAPPIYLADISETVNHKVPLSVGLSVAYGLTRRMALQTGLTYTRAASDFSNNIRGAVITTEQTLHYVGIPLQLRYDVWRWGSLDAYATAGGQLDVNVKAEAETEGVTRHTSRDRAQWSLLGGVGLQYDIAPQLGLYGEVGARWYPDNGSQVETYFKDKPLGMSVQVGLRLNVGK